MHKLSTEPGSRLDEATRLARSIVQAMDKTQSVSVTLRQCEELGRLTDDDFIQAYAVRALEPGGRPNDTEGDVQYVRVHKDARASGILQYLKDFQVSGEPFALQLNRGGTLNFALSSRSAPEAETFISAARRSVKYTVEQREFMKSIEEAEAVLERVRNRLYRYVSAVLNRLLKEWRVAK